MSHVQTEAIAPIPSIDATRKILQVTEKKWKRPGYTPIIDRKMIDFTSLGWIDLGNRAKAGYKIDQKAEHGEITGDAVDFQSFLAFQETTSEPLPSFIVVVQSAFAQLLSLEAKKLLTTRLPVIPVTDNVRQKIVTLVNNMEEIDGISLPRVKIEGSGSYWG